MINVSQQKKQGGGFNKKRFFNFDEGVPKDQKASEFIADFLIENKSSARFSRKCLFKHKGIEFYFSHSIEKYTINNKEVYFCLPNFYRDDKACFLIRQHAQYYHKLKKDNKFYEVPRMINSEDIEIIAFNNLVCLDKFNKRTVFFAKAAFAIGKKNPGAKPSLVSEKNLEKKIIFKRQADKVDDINNYQGQVGLLREIKINKLANSETNNFISSCRLESVTGEFVIHDGKDFKYSPRLNMIRAMYVMNYYGENINQFLKKHDQLSYPEVIKLYSAVLKALKRLHDRNLVHTDLKCDNLIVNQDSLESDAYKINLIDGGHFGSLGEKIKESLLSNKYFILPEFIYENKGKRIQNYITKDLDIFAAVIVFCEILWAKDKLKRSYLYDRSGIRNAADLFSLIKSEKQISAPFLQFIGKALNMNEFTRLTIDEITEVVAKEEIYCNFYSLDERFDVVMSDKENIPPQNHSQFNKHLTVFPLGKYNPWLYESNIKEKRSPKSSKTFTPSALLNMSMFVEKTKLTDHGCKKIKKHSSKMAKKFHFKKNHLLYSKI